MGDPTDADEWSATLHGWGRTAPVRSRVRPATASTVAASVRSAGPRGVLARGLGRSYGDAAQNAGGLVLLPVPGRVEVDEANGTATVPAGTSLDQLSAVLLPRGWFLPVTPGTRQVSVGGAIASDVHGKNHRRAGSFADHVVSFGLVGPDGSDTEVGADSELFWATAGGMGLTGVITHAVLRLRRVGSAYLRTTTERVSDLDTLLARLDEASTRADHAAAWLDLTARGPARGRAVLQSADHVERGAVPSGVDPLAAPARTRIRVPVTSPGSLVNRLTVRAFDEVWFRRAPRLPTARVEHLAGFLWPLDSVTGWNRLYGPRGLVQYQLAVPDGAERALGDAVDLVARSGVAPFLGVLKRLGPANRGWLSFPTAGWTLAADLPVSPRLAGLFRELGSLVSRAGGRVYLAKDGVLDPTTLRRMYPRAEEFRRWRLERGMAEVFVSDLSRRLNL